MLKTGDIGVDSALCDNNFVAPHIVDYFFAGIYAVAVREEEDGIFALSRRYNDGQAERL